MSYLTDRKQCVEINIFPSDFCTPKFGVLQDSVLEQLLSTVNFMPLGDQLNQCRLKYRIYADEILFFVDLDELDSSNVVTKLQNIISHQQSQQAKESNCADQTQWKLFGKLQTIAISVSDWAHKVPLSMKISKIIARFLKNEHFIFSLAGFVVPKIWKANEQTYAKIVHLTTYADLKS